jgi:thioredoxin-related protein
LKRILVSLIVLFMSVFSYTMSQPSTPESADKILESALQKARDSNKNVFLIFHATWCKWCSRLETALDSPEVKKIIEKHYVVARLDVLERGEKKQTDENPGGVEILNKSGGEKSGLPFLAFLNAKNKMIANSNVMPGNQNIGYPGSKEEISAFIKLLKKTAPKMSRKQAEVIRDYLVKNAPKQ